MSRQLDNVNPTIFAPTHASSSRQKSGKALLWNEHAEGYAEVDGGSGAEGSEGEIDEREEIDSEEVFGASGSADSADFADFTSGIRAAEPRQTYSAPSPIRNTPSRSSSSAWSIPRTYMSRATGCSCISPRRSLIAPCRL
jgi:hypothetical protein